jgi:uncharacterized protein YjdB
MTLPSIAATRTPSRPLRRLLPALLLLALSLALSSCLGGNKDDVYVLSFNLDTAQLGRHDSLRFEIYNDRAPAPGEPAEPVQVVTVKTPEGSNKVEIRLAGEVKPDFAVVVIGFGENGESQRKLFEFADFKTDPDVKPANLIASISGSDLTLRTGERKPASVALLPADASDKRYVLASDDSGVVRIAGMAGDSLEAVAAGSATITITAMVGGASGRFTVTVTDGPGNIPVQGLSAKDVRALVGDTLLPDLEFDPADATDQGYELASLDTAVVRVAGDRLAAVALGTADVEVASKDGGFQATFKVSVLPPAFETDVLPITRLKCAPCHIPGQVLNFQDSAMLVRKGASALDRLQRAPDAAGKMPLKGSENGDLTDRELAILLAWLRQNVVPVEGMTASDMQVALGDTVAPDLAWTPSDASNQMAMLTSIDSAVVGVTEDGRLYPRSMGETTLLAESDEGGIKDQFKVKVLAPSFTRNVLPITAVKCAPCHVPGQTFDFQDSSVLILAGATSLERLQRDSLAAGKMPLRGAPAGDLTPLEKEILLAWLKTKVVPLKGIDAADDSVLVDQSKAPAITYDPPDANNKSYALESTDTTKVVIDGDRYLGKAVGSATVRVRSLEGNHLDTFTVKVKPVPVDSVVAADTSGAVGDTVEPRVEILPENAGDKVYTLSLPRASTIIRVVAGNKAVVGLAVGKDTVLATSRDGKKQARLVFTVGPVVPRGLTGVDTNGVIGQLVVPRIIWNPANTTNKVFSLSIAASDTNVAALRTSNRIQGKAVGAVNVTVRSAADSTLTDVFRFTVGPVAVTGISATARTMVCSTSLVARPFIAFSPSNATDKGFSLASSAPARISVTNDTTIRALRLGLTQITVTSKSNASATAVWNVTVVRPPFTGAVKNTFNLKCGACHGPTTWEARNWQDSTLVVTHRTAILARIGATDGTKMPPASSTQLTAAELKTLRDWLNIQ